MTPSEMLREARKIVETCDGDEEDTHAEHDELMAKVLTSLGYGEAIELIFTQNRWYA